ncbi:hypothetical protein ACFPRL_23410 [Pseudoclavibacter helvolus]
MPLLRALGQGALDRAIRGTLPHEPGPGAERTCRQILDQTPEPSIAGHGASARGSSASCRAGQAPASASPGAQRAVGSSLRASHRGAPAPSRSAVVFCSTKQIIACLSVLGPQRSRVESADRATGIPIPTSVFTGLLTRARERRSGDC